MIPFPSESKGNSEETKQTSMEEIIQNERKNSEIEKCKNS